jgi:Tfp pilus assembly protein PilF
MLRAHGDPGHRRKALWRTGKLYDSVGEPGRGDYAKCQPKTTLPVTPPDSRVELIQRAVQALQRGAAAEAVELAQAVLRSHGPEANALLVLASVRAEAGDLQGAIDLYERARQVMPTHIHVLVNLASVYRATGRFAEARRTLAAALQVDPRFAIAHNNLGNVLTDLGQRPEALHSYQRAAALDPSYADPIAGLAGMAEEEHRLEEARSLAERALQLAPTHVTARLTLARIKLRQNDASGATPILEALLHGATLSTTNRILALGILGDAYDKLARYDEAFAAFTGANALQLEQCAPTIARDRGPLTPASVAQMAAFMAGARPAEWRSAPPAAVTPVFLVGFPRSGTTLLDQILASHPGVTTLEERDTLIGGANELLVGEGGYERLAAIPDDEIERLRDHYWQRVRAGLAAEPLRRVFIDKQPLNAVLLPLIHRQFPEAKVILAVRDPRDVVLSCYQQRFGINAAMYQLLRLDTATAYYEAVMRLVELCRAKLPLRVHVVKYEEVIGSFEATMTDALRFLGLEWHDGMRQYTETARKRSISTPSAAQVVRPLYGDSRGRWRNYSKFLAPFLPPLLPWVEAFGYDVL